MPKEEIKEKEKPKEEYITVKKEELPQQEIRQVLSDDGKTVYNIATSEERIQEISNDIKKILNIVQKLA